MTAVSLPISEALPLLEPSRWGTAMALYMICFITYGATLVFYAALFPRLACNTPHARKLRDMDQAGEILTEEYEAEESLESHRISNISNVCSWLRFSSLPPGLTFESPSHYRMDYRALFELDPATAFGRSPQGQKLRFGIMRARTAAKIHPRP